MNAGEGASSLQYITPKNDASPGSVSLHPSDAAGDKTEENWSEEDSATEHGDELGRERKRKRKGPRRPMSVSCEMCKLRKVRCDRGQPHCGWCVRNGQLCEYTERKKPGLRAGYGRELEARLDKLEGLLQSQQQSINQLTGVSSVKQDDSAAFRTPPAPQAHISHSEPATFQHHASPYHHQTPAVAGYTSEPRLENSDAQHRPPLSLNHLSSSVSEMYAPTNPPLESPSLNISEAPQTSISSQDHDFPPYDLLYALTDLFFKHINTWCPILHRMTTLNALFGPSTLEEADRILLHAIVATTLRFSTDPRLDASTKERYHAVSRQKVLLYGLDNSSVKALQALVILALDTVGSSNGPPGWNLLALITRSIVQLGLAVETTSASVSPPFPSIYTLRAMVLPESRTWIEDESRRRLFWMVYLLDRYATIATAFEFALDDKEIDRRLPCRDDFFLRNQPVETRWFRTDGRTDYSTDHPENLGPFSYYIEIVGILSQIHRFLKKPVDIGALSDVEQWQQEYRRLDTMLNRWKLNLPTEYGNMARLFNPNGNNKTVNCIWVMLHVTYHTTVIRLHSSAAYPTTRSPIFTPSFSASQRCQTAVEDICCLCTYVRNNQVLTRLGPPFAFSLWVAARLLLVRGSTVDHRVDPAIYLLVETLQEMGVYWKVAGRYATLLQRVLDEYNESERAPAGANGERVTPSTVRILADMRRCAYDLDFLISRQPRQHFGAAGPPSITPARTPAPNDFEYLDVFDFFNLPRLPFPADVPMNASGAEFQTGDTNNEFNITNFTFDANSDWFMNSTT
ncbi:hypothetical protein LTR66_006161 [Elasticomyces elasticus]|nr:hypothetical protein LTR66_006161 [Elasticomyces elasticus]